MDTRGRSYWFAAKAYGIGWTLPVTWQGWAVVVIYLALATFALMALDTRRAGLIAVGALTLALIAIIVWKGEKPARWRWRGH